MASAISFLTTFIINIISRLGYAGVGLLMAIESACIPLPSEVIAPFAGFLVSMGRFNLFGVALVGGLGSTVGSWIVYEIGKYGGRPLVEKYGKWFLISTRDIENADIFFDKYGSLSTFIGRLLPVVRTFISLPAGIARVPKKTFLLYSFIGSFIWTLFLAFLGLKLGQNWITLQDKFHWLDTVVVLLVIIGVFYWIYRHFKHSKNAANLL
jgi:membrane protein DedA with SNARE-associated domain